jgi:hypothetical protein
LDSTDDSRLHPALLLLGIFFSYRAQLFFLTRAPVIRFAKPCTLEDTPHNPSKPKYLNMSIEKTTSGILVKPDGTMSFSMQLTDWRGLYFREASNNDQLIKDIHDLKIQLTEQKDTITKQAETNSACLKSNGELMIALNKSVTFSSGAEAVIQILQRQLRDKERCAECLANKFIRNEVDDLRTANKELLTQHKQLQMTLHIRDKEILSLTRSIQTLSKDLKDSKAITTIQA